MIVGILIKTKKAARVCLCDLKLCYVRIVHSFASMAMHQVGAPTTSVVNMFRTTHKIKHAVRTSHGTLDHNFGSEDWPGLKKLQGVRQGNGTRFVIWAVISTVFKSTL